MTEYNVYRTGLWELLLRKNSFTIVAQGFTLFKDPSRGEVDGDTSIFSGLNAPRTMNTLTYSTQTSGLALAELKTGLRPDL